MAIASAADLVESLRDFRLLQPAQLEKITHALQGRSVDARTLAKELVKHGYLTTFQVNRLVQGRGAELVLGDYLLLDQLGEGGMGQVFKARHQRLNRVVALKVIRPECLASPELVERFHREVQAVASLSHPNIIAAQDARQVGKVHLLVTEYVEGTDLQRLVKKSGPLAVGQACEYVRQAALGLQHAAANKLIHRDIKPSNLQVTADGKVVKILDMGLARLQAESPGGAAGLTKAHTVMGTPDYIAPEQIVDARSVDCRADIYSLGCTFYFLLAGRPPFGSVDRWEEKLVCHQKAEPQLIEQVRPDVPSQVGAILRKMMAKRPEDRYSAAATVADDLAPYCQTAGPVPAAPVSLIDRPADGTERGWTLPTSSVVTPAPAPASLPAPSWGPKGVENPQQPASPAPGQQTTVLEGPPIPRAGKRFWLVLAAGVVIGMLPLLVILLWPKGQPSSPTNEVANPKLPDPTVKSDLPVPEKPKQPEPTVINDYRIEVVSCELRGHELTCKLKFTNLRNNQGDFDGRDKGGGGRGAGHRYLRIRLGGRASATFDNGTIIRQNPGGITFDGLMGQDLTQPGVNMDKDDHPREMIVKFADIPEGVKKVTVLDFGFEVPDRDIRVRNIEIERK